MTPPATHIDTTLIPIVSSTILPSPEYTPTSPDYTHASPDYSPTSDTETGLSKDPSSDHIQPLLATSPFLSSIDDFSGSDILDTPPSPTYVMVLAPGQPIPHGRPYSYNLNGPVHTMTMRKWVGPSPTHRLAMRHSVDYSSLDHFALDDSLGDSSSSLSSSSSSETSSDPSSNDLSDSSFDRSLPTPSSSVRPSHHLCSLVLSIPHSPAMIIDRPSHDYFFACPPHKRSKSPVASVPLSSPIPGALSYARANFLPSPKRIRNLEFATELEVSSKDSFEPYVPGETDLEMDVDVVRSDGIEIDLEIQADINECIAYADALRDREIDARVVAIKGIQRDQGHRIIATGQQGADMFERIRELERVNMKLKDMMDVASQRLTRSQHRELREAFGLPFLDYFLRALGARDVARNLEPLMGNKGMEMEEMEIEEIEIEEMETKEIEMGNVIAAEPTKLQDVIRIANNLMDQKLKGYARSTENKKRLENNLRDNHGQQSVFKWQYIGGQNVARAYTARNNEKKGYVRSLPYCNKCKMHHAGTCAMRCGNCKRVGHMTRDCKVTVTLNTQRALVGN
uniref:Reverse transcriptase domain-containing protein n=1 Tax=Tanacetum cinerariifolium TaxID=118510 RepID=A0A6L2KBQ9_TANCI|nr:reverse transcriptase domain-containing protein [Tanacetum cinerariifolium]